jgi:Reverse transcriptase (RNA-dependent DNA polymerase)
VAIGKYRFTRVIVTKLSLLPIMAPTDFYGYLSDKWKTCLVYLDDVIVFSGSRSAHLAHVAEVLTLLGNAGLSLKLKKCHFFSETVDYLGHVIRPGRLEVAEKNTTALKKARQPHSDGTKILIGAV